MCEMCGIEASAKNIAVDHIEPFTPVEGINSIGDLLPAITRLFDLDNHQVLCKPCHSKKTQEENSLRRKARK